MPSIASRLMPPLLALRGSKRTFASAAATLDRIAELQIHPQQYSPPRRLIRNLDISVSHEAGWPVYRVAPAGRTPTRHAVYTHGGAWLNQIDPRHWHLIAQIVKRTSASVTVPIYPLLPLGSAGQVVPGVADLVTRLIDQYGAERVTVMGDSAGGQITLSTVLLLRRRGVPSPKCTILISPALDLTFTDPEIGRIEPHDPFLSVPGPRAAAKLWAAELPIEHMLVSPLFSDLSGLGKIVLFSGTRDCVHPDSRRLATNALHAGVDLDYHEAAQMFHDYPLMPIPEGRQATRAILNALA